MQGESRDPRTYAIIGAAMEVHRELGCGFLEAVYQEAMELELDARDIAHRREIDLSLMYKGQELKTTYRADFICFEHVIVEIKALKQLGGVEESQMINYLKTTGMEVGLLINFGTQSLEHKRIVYSKYRHSSPS